MEPITENNPILYVDIKHGEERVSRLSIYEGDDPNLKVEGFAQSHGIKREIQNRLVEYVQQ